MKKRVRWEGKRGKDRERGETCSADCRCVVVPVGVSLRVPFLESDLDGSTAAAAAPFRENAERVT